MGRHHLPHPFEEGRTHLRVVMADKPMVAIFLDPRRHPEGGDIVLMREQPHLELIERLHDVVRLLGHLPRADRDMRLAILQPEQSLPGQKAQGHIGVFPLERDQQRGHPA